MTDDWVCFLKRSPVGSHQVVLDVFHCYKVSQLDGVLFLSLFMLSHQGGIVCLSVGHMQVSSSFDGLIHSFLLYFTPGFTVFAIGQVVLECRRSVLVLNFYFGGGTQLQ